MIAAWNGLALAALAEGGRRLGRGDLVDAARDLGGLLAADPLWRTLRDGRARYPAYLEDYANVAHGLVELHVATGELRWLHEARRIALRAVELFADEERGGFFLTPADGEQLVARRKDLDDNPTPSGNAMLAFVLIRLARIWGEDELERHAAGALRLVRDALPRAPSAFGWSLCALDLLPVAVTGARDRRPAGQRRRPRGAPRLRPERGRGLRAGRGRPAPRRARASSTGSRPSTCASASSAARR